MVRYGFKRRMTLQDLVALFEKPNLERGNKAEDIIWEFLKQKYPIVLDFRFPKELTEKISEYAKQTKVEKWEDTFKPTR